MKKRLRKKRHLGEFQEIGFEVSFTFEPGATIEEDNDLLFAFLDYAIEDNGLLFGGGGRDGSWSGVAYADGPPGTRTSPEQRGAVLEWLNRHPRMKTIRAGEFFDLWHDELPSDSGAEVAPENRSAEVQNVNGGHF